MEFQPEPRLIDALVQEVRDVLRPLADRKNIDLTTEVPRLLRPGSIAREAIERALGRDVDAPAFDDPSTPRAPGGLARHYAPRKPLELVEASRLAARVHELGANRVAVLAPAPPMPAVARWWITPPGPELYAHHLYEFLHRMDGSGAERLLVQRPPREPQWAALNDRLERAAAALSGEFDDAD